MKKVKVGIVGGSGYTGIELLRLLAQHPHAEIVTITGRKDAGTHVAKMFPSLRGRVDLVFEDPASAPLDQCDVVFFATPHGVAMSMAEELTSKGVKVIDLAADFRLKDKEVFKKWYKMDHKCPDILAKAVYGQPESMRDEMKKADVLGMAGCYPTTIELGLMPLLKLHKEVGDIVNLDVSIIADSKSGISGAGRKADISLNCAEFSDNFKAYGVAGHRHEPEMVQQLSLFAGVLLCQLKDAGTDRFQTADLGGHHGVRDGIVDLPQLLRYIGPLVQVLGRAQASVSGAAGEPRRALPEYWCGYQCKHLHRSNRGK